LKILLVRNNILESGVVLHEFEGKTSLGDIVSIVGREVVFVEANGAIPGLELEVN
jgi:hypothetical protein